MKETSITTPMVFGAWLLFREKKIREALYFFAPAIALGAWLVLLHHKTGHWLGNEEFARDNVGGALSFMHILLGFGGRLHFLFIADGRFIGTIALFAGFRMLRGKDWQIAALVAVAQVVVVTVFGYAMLERYLIPGAADSLRRRRRGRLGLSHKLAMGFAHGDAGDAHRRMVLESALSVFLRK